MTYKSEVGPSASVGTTGGEGNALTLWSLSREERDIYKIPLAFRERGLGVRGIPPK